MTRADRLYLQWCVHSVIIQNYRGARLESVLRKKNFPSINTIPKRTCEQTKFFFFHIRSLKYTWNEIFDEILDENSIIWVETVSILETSTIRSYEFVLNFWRTEFWNVPGAKKWTRGLWLIKRKSYLWTFQ